MLLSCAIDTFIASVCAGKRNETPDAYRKKLKRLVVFLGDVQLETVQAVDLDRFRLALLTQRIKRRGNVLVIEPLSVWYIRGLLRTVKHFFRWSADEGLLPVNVADKLKVPKRPPVEPKAISQATFDKLLDAAGRCGDSWARTRNVAFLCLLRDTGGRLGGLVMARVSGLDLNASTLVVIEKGDRSRPLFLTDTTREVMRRWLDVRAELARCDALFIGRRGTTLTASGARGILRRLAISAGVLGERFNPHSFRHAFARDTLRAGADLSEVSQMMGHSGIGVTGDYYARWLPNELKEVHKRTAAGRGVRDSLCK